MSDKVHFVRNLEITEAEIRHHRLDLIRNGWGAPLSNDESRYIQLRRSLPRLHAQLMSSDGNRYPGIYRLYRHQLLLARHLERFVEPLPGLVSDDGSSEPITLPPWPQEIVSNLRTPGDDYYPSLGWADIEGSYCYSLTRRWMKPIDEDNICADTLLVIGLNPSMATATEDDQIVTKIERQARLLMFGAVTIVHLYAYMCPHAAQRSGTSETIKTLKARAIGPRNDVVITDHLMSHKTVVVCWGNVEHNNWAPRALTGIRKNVVRRIIRQTGRRTYAFRVSKNGHPMHISRLPYSEDLVRWNP